jgi:tetratricopeptide (TPR) repeat protein
MSGVTNRAASMQRIVPRIVVEPPLENEYIDDISATGNNSSHRTSYVDLDSLGTFVESDSDDDSVFSNSRQSIASTAPSENNRAGKSDEKLMGTLLKRASTRRDANKILEKFGHNYVETLPKDIRQLEHLSPSPSKTPATYVSANEKQRFTGAELGSIQDVLVRYESKAYDLLAAGRHDRALKTCKQLRALIRRLSNEGVVDHHGSVAGAGCGDRSNNSNSAILLKLYAMAVESEAYFLNGKLKRAKKRLFEMDIALAKLASSTDKPLSQLPRAVRCAVACYTMLGNLFSLEARRMRLKSYKQRYERSKLNVSEHSILVSSHHSLGSSNTSKHSSQYLLEKQKHDEEAYKSTLDLAVEAFRHAVKLRKEEGGNPGFGHTLLGEVLVVQGNFVEATSEFEHALKCAFRFGTVHPIQERRNLGDALLIRNNYAAALTQYTSCVRSMAIDLNNLVAGSTSWSIEMLAQAAVCCTISTCLRALGQLDQAHLILEEAKKMVFESGAMNNPKHVLHGTDSQKHITFSRSKQSSSRSSIFKSTPNKSFKFKNSTPPNSGKVTMSSLREKGTSAFKSPSQHRLDQQTDTENRRMRMSTIGVTTGEASLELLVRISVEKGHLHIRKGDWKLALECYQDAENRLDYKLESGVNILDPTRSIALRGTIIMFLGDVFAYRISKLIENSNNSQESVWQTLYDEKEEKLDNTEHVGNTETVITKSEDENGETKMKNNGDSISPEKRVKHQRYNGNDLYGRAMECYEQSYYMACDVTDETDPYRITCLARIGQLHSLCRRWDRALPVLRNCLASSQHIAVIHRQLRAGLSVAVADVLRHGADTQQHEAIELYTSALKLFHDSAGANCAEMGAAFLGIGRIWTSRGNYSTALRVSSILLHRSYYPLPL